MKRVAWDFSVETLRFFDAKKQATSGILSLRSLMLRPDVSIEQTLTRVVSDGGGMSRT